MNKFYFAIVMIIVGVFLGIFFITQKDSLFKSPLLNNSAQVLPTLSNSLELTVLTPQPSRGSLNSFLNEKNVNPTFGVEEGVKASYSAVIKTSKGDIELILFGSDAPRTVKNFINKAKTNYYKNFSFHRVEDWVIQGGDPKGDGTGGGLMQTEINQIAFARGSLGVARGSDINISNDSQFFITKSEAHWLNQQYTNFGEVTSGMDVVEKIEIGDRILGITIE
jgi:cyclophilin family peptidyl-prolyl cis-trans isomerase